MRLKKILVILSTILVCIIVLIAAVYLLEGHTTSHIGVDDVRVNDNEITLKGKILSSAIKYRGHRVKYDNGVLYIKIRGGVMSLFSDSGSIDISIKNKYGEINKIYLEGHKPSENKLIWSD